MTISTKIKFMDIHTGQQRPFPAVAIVAVLLLLCIIAGQYWLPQLFPGISGLARINPSVVLLDIPLPLPLQIDLVVVPALFLLVYPLVVLLYPSRTGISPWRQAMLRARSVSVGLFAVLFCTLSGGLIYYLGQGYLPRNVRNGIESFGIHADIHLPYPGYETIHLRGSTVLLVCFMFGLWICIRKIKKEPGTQPAQRLTREQRMTPYERMMEEKRANKKQMPPETRTKKKGYKADKSPQPVVPAAARPGLCRHQPVVRFKPEAVNYMPLS